MLTGPDVVTGALRALALIAVMQAAGCAIYLSFHDRELGVVERALRTSGWAAAAFAVVLTLAEHALGPARMTGTFAGVADGALHALLLASDAGAARALRTAGLLLIGWSALGGHRLSTQLGLVGAIVTLGSFGVMGHTANDEQRWILSILLLLHLTIAAWWLGALTTFWLGATREPLTALARLVTEFSRLASRLVPLVLVAGIVMAALLLPDLAALGSTYGLLLMAKLAGFAVLMVLAASNKLRLGPALARGEARALAAFTRVVAAEWVIIATVLAVTAVMTGFFGPE